MEKPPHKAKPVVAYPPPPPNQQQYPAWYGYQPYLQPPPLLPLGYPQGQPACGYPPQGGYGYLPQQHGGYWYPPPQQHGGYGYPPPQQGGYGYPPQGQKPGMNKFGMSFIAGLLRGDFGGLLFGNMVSDNFCDDYGFDFF